MLFVPVVGPIREAELPSESAEFVDKAYELLNSSNIELVSIPGNFYVMVVDGDGACWYSSKLVNIRASPLYGGFPSAYIYGDVLIGKYNSSHTDVVGLSDVEILNFKKIHILRR